MGEEEGGGGAFASESGAEAKGSFIAPPDNVLRTGGGGSTKPGERRRSGRCCCRCAEAKGEGAAQGVGLCGDGDAGGGEAEPRGGQDLSDPAGLRALPRALLRRTDRDAPLLSNYSFSVSMSDSCELASLSA